MQVVESLLQGGCFVDIRPLKAKFQTQVAEMEKNAINTGDRDLRNSVNRAPRTRR